MPDNSFSLEYSVGSRYYNPSEEPPTDSVGLVIEAIPIYKLWYSLPLDIEQVALAGVCTHIGLVPPSRFPGGLPIFLFKATTGESLLVRAPLVATQQEVERWAAGDSNAVMFTLIERGSQIIRQNRFVGIPADLLSQLKSSWLSANHPLNMREVSALLTIMTDQTLLDAATIWAYNEQTDEFEQGKSRTASV